MGAGNGAFNGAAAPGPWQATRGYVRIRRRHPAACLPLRGPVQSIRVIDSHTGGEPTRVVLEGGPSLSGPFTERIAALRRDHDGFRSAVCNEPRGSDVMVGALLLPPVDPTAAPASSSSTTSATSACAATAPSASWSTLAHLGRIEPGTHRIETPVGVVTVELRRVGHASRCDNVPELSRTRKGVAGRGARARRRDAATSPGAATGSSWSTSTASELDAGQRRAR